jgi:voltage-gated potassium channel Kch
MPVVRWLRPRPRLGDGDGGDAKMSTLYRVFPAQTAKQRLGSFRRRALGLLSALLLLIVGVAAGLVLLDDSALPLRTKLLNGLWNAMNLVTTVGDFDHLEAHQRLLLLVSMLVVIVIGGSAIGRLSGILSDPAVVAYRENRKMERKLEGLTGHAVVIGYVSRGRVLAQRLRADGLPVLVIDRDADLAARAADRGFNVIQGDAGSDDETLGRAGLERAHALFIATTDANRNLAITLTARTLNATLAIAVCADDDREAELLRRAGASQVVVLDHLLAVAMMQSAKSAGGPPAAAARG